MNAKELAEKLNGSEYPLRLDMKLRAEIRAAGLVVVFGASDDLIEIDGAIYDEGSCYEGGEFKIDSQGILPSTESIDHDEDELEKYFIRKKTAKKIKAIWDKDGYSWTYETDIPHETFDIVEDGEKYCRAMVINGKEFSQ